MLKQMLNRTHVIHCCEEESISLNCGSMQTNFSNSSLVTRQHATKQLMQAAFAYNHLLLLAIFSGHNLY